MLAIQSSPASVAVDPWAQFGGLAGDRQQEARRAGHRSCGLDLEHLNVDVTSSVVDDGTQIQVWGCDNTAAQEWTIGSDGTIRAFGKCLDVAFGGTANGTKVQLWGCDNTGSQQWVYRPYELVNPQSNKCLGGRGWRHLMGYAHGDLGLPGRHQPAVEPAVTPP